MDFRLRAKQLKVHTTGNKHTNKQTNQFCRGQITLEAVAEHVSKQLHWTAEHTSCQEEELL